MCCIVKYLLEMYYISKENKEYIIIILFKVIFDHDKGVFITVFSLFSYFSGYIHESFNTNPCPVHIKTFNRFQSVAALYNNNYP
jgi:hypothetical protein